MSYAKTAEIGSGTAHVYGVYVDAIWHADFMTDGVRNQHEDDNDDEPKDPEVRYPTGPRQEPDNPQIPDPLPPTE